MTDGGEGQADGDRPEAVPTPQRPVLSLEQLGRIRSLIDTIQSELPVPYREELFRQLLPSALGHSSAATVAALQPPVPGATSLGSTELTGPGLQSGAGVTETAAGRSRVNLARYSALLGLPGRTLLKALVALEAAGEQLTVDWMSPSEIERFLVERARVRSVYRTNLSNALRGARQLVDRRRRGRGYEYRITTQGKSALDRELAMFGGG